MYAEGRRVLECRLEAGNRLAAIRQPGQCIEPGQTFELLLHLDPVVDDAQGPDESVDVAVGVHIGLAVAVDPVVVTAQGAQPEAVVSRFAVGHPRQRPGQCRDVIGVEVAAEI